MEFDLQPTLRSDALLVQPLIQSDFEGLYQSASDPLVWAGHPATNRHERPIFETYFAFLVDVKAVSITDISTGQIIGCSKFYTPPDQDHNLSIGFTFLAHPYWGGQTNSEMKRLMLDHIFEQQSDAWFHIAPNNIRSQKATQKLGAKFVGKEVFDLGTGSADWFTYRLKQTDWDQVVARRA